MASYSYILKKDGRIVFLPPSSDRLPWISESELQKRRQAEEKSRREEMNRLLMQIADKYKPCLIIHYETEDERKLRTNP